MAVVPLFACSSSSASSAPTASACPIPAGCPAPDPATTASLDSPSISFGTQIVPLFQQSCAVSSSCHSMQQGGPSGLYLGGPKTMPADPTGILAAIVSKPAEELPTMQLVAPGDPTKSFLMHKLDGDACTFASQCSATPVAQCGASMPLSGCALDGATRDMVRRWIAQGAMNN